MTMLRLEDWCDMVIEAQPDPPQQVIKTHPARNQRLNVPFPADIQTSRGIRSTAMTVETIESEVPGCVIYDTFGPSGVLRSVARWTDHTTLTTEMLRGLCERLVAHKSPLRRDPFGPLLEEGGLNALRAQKLLADMAQTQNWGGDERSVYAERLVTRQSADGSWDQNPVNTAFSLVRLHELDVSPDNPCVERGIHWLLAYPEPPVEIAGLWMFGDLRWSDTNHERYAQRHGEAYWEGVKAAFQSQAEIQLTSCDMLFFDLSAIALEALLRYGQHEHPRVQQAICTLFAWSDHEQDKVRGCDAITAREPVAAQRPDFDSFGVPDSDYRNSRKAVSRYLPWFTTTREALRMYPGRYNSGTRYANYSVGEERTLCNLVKADSRGGLCFLHLHRALSFHPDYPGSRLATLGAFHHSALQNACGRFFGGGANVLSHLSFATDPIAAAIVLKSIPVLVSEQRDDGLFEPWVACITRKGHSPGTNPQHHDYSRETTTWYVLKALHQFGFLEQLAKPFL